MGYCYRFTTDLTQRMLADAQGLFVQSARTAPTSPTFTSSVNTGPSPGQSLTWAS